MRSQEESVFSSLGGAMQVMPVVNPDFSAGFQKATLDFELKYSHQSFPVDEEQLCLIFVRVSCGLDQSDLWKTGYLAGLYAALYHVLDGWHMSYTWDVGECIHADAYHVESIRRGS